MYLVQFPMKDHPDVMKVDCSFSRLADAIRYSRIVIDSGHATRSLITTDDGRIITPDEINRAIITTYEQANFQRLHTPLN